MSSGRAALCRHDSAAICIRRYDLQAEPAGTRAKSKARGQGLPDVKPYAAADGVRKERYLDGRLVSTRGEKFITQTTGEEWDGGSTGKVITKGKRGRGFV